MRMLADRTPEPGASPESLRPRVYSPPMAHIERPQRPASGSARRSPSPSRGASTSRSSGRSSTASSRGSTSSTSRCSGERTTIVRRRDAVRPALCPGGRPARPCACASNRRSARSRSRSPPGAWHGHEFPEVRGRRLYDGGGRGRPARTALAACLAPNACRPSRDIAGHPWHPESDTLGRNGAAASHRRGRRPRRVRPETATGGAPAGAGAPGTGLRDARHRGGRLPGVRRGGGPAAWPRATARSASSWTAPASARRWPPTRCRTCWRLRATTRRWRGTAASTTTPTC